MTLSIHRRETGAQTLPPPGSPPDAQAAHSLLQPQKSPAAYPCLFPWLPLPRNWECLEGGPVCLTRVPTAQLPGSVHSLAQTGQSWVKELGSERVSWLPEMTE